MKKMILIMFSTLMLLFTSLSNAGYVAVVVQNKNFETESGAVAPPPPSGGTLICGSGEGVTRSELITMIDNGDDVTNVCTSNITDFSSLFSLYRGSSATEVVRANFNQDISGWDVSNGTRFDDLFNESVMFNQDISGWNVSNGVNFARMFYSSPSFNQDISSWDVSNATDLREMFYGTTFNPDIGDWRVGNNEWFYGMFAYNPNFNRNLSEWDVGKGTYFNSMFEESNSFSQDLSSWDVSSSVYWASFGFNSGLATEQIPTKFRD